MPDPGRELSQEYWRPPPTAEALHSWGFQVQANEAFCASCGTPYAAGARYCHVCGLAREDDLHADAQGRFMDWLDLDSIRAQFGLSTISLVLLVAATVFLLATLLTGVVYNTTTIAEWQAVQTWRIEWLLATVTALLAAMLFKTRR